ncbi:hypothetical protein [Amycolatopsis sp. NPDC059657]|uniref:hypothetical protein n=1 Tax=Amycolatopsis sp. NPDC059657 TaxID=3346899 RepID=UPI003671CB1F
MAGTVDRQDQEALRRQLEACELFEVRVDVRKPTGSQVHSRSAQIWLSATFCGPEASLMSMSHDTASTPESNGCTKLDDEELPRVTSLSARDRLDLARWHIDRYDRLRASTSSRAAVVLSAGAILTAGNAVILSQLLQQTLPANVWLVTICTVGLTISAALIVLAIIRATGVLVSLRLTREMFPESDLPTGLVFNATDTVRHAPEFRRFYQVVGEQNLPDVLLSAHVELWIIIRQHRHRYAKLRDSVRALRYAAMIFLVVLTVLVITNLIIRVVW